MRAMRAHVCALCMSLAGAAPPQWRLLWSDEFIGNAGAPPDASMWNVADKPGLAGNKELEYYSPTAVALDGAGNLALTSTVGSQHADFNYTSGWVDSQGKQAGMRPEHAPVRWEIRARVPTGQGIWPGESAGAWLSMALR